MNASEARKLASEPAKKDNIDWVIQRIKQEAMNGKTSIFVEAEDMTPATKLSLEKLGYHVFLTSRERHSLDKWINRPIAVYFVQW